jgi:hypothetical protein
MGVEDKERTGVVTLSGRRDDIRGWSGVERGGKGRRRAVDALLLVWSASRQQIVRVKFVAKLAIARRSGAIVM